MRCNLLKIQWFACQALLGGIYSMTAAAQAAPSAKEREMIDGSDNTLYYTMAFVVIAVLGLAFYLWRKSKKGDASSQSGFDNRHRAPSSTDSYDMDGVDAEKELEWFRKAKISGAKTANGFNPKGQLKKKATIATSSSSAPNFDTKEFQERMRKLQYAGLPINSFGSISASKSYEELPVSDDPSLLNAIEQANDEYEEDETVRDLAVRILMAFRTRNSVESLTQIALYDLSSNLRSKAVSVLTDFDHDSVFEAILLACADPTREVRAAAARGLFRLNFDRADAWKRIMETDDEFRMRHAARAAVESGIVEKTFERLVHEDLKVSYEAFVLVALLIKSGEIDEIFEAIASHKDERVKFALLHVLRVVKDERTLTHLNRLRTGQSFTAEVAERIADAVKSFEKVTV